MIRKALIAVALLLPGCTQVPMANPQADQAAKAFPPPEPGRGALYVYRSGVMGLGRPIDVSVAGGATAQLPYNSYIRLEGPPGPIEVDCKVGDNTGARQLEISEGRTRFLEVTMTVMSVLPGCELAEVPPNQGEAAVRSSKRVAMP